MAGSQFKEKMFKCLGQGHKNILSADRWPLTTIQNKTKYKMVLL